MATDFDYFKNEFKVLLGVDLNQYHREQLERRLRNFLSSQFSLDKTDNRIFQLAIDELKRNNVFRILIYEALTINHSYFFRNRKQWDYLINIIKQNRTGTLKIWSAGCSSGEEPYTLAMLLDTHFPQLQFKIFASDIDKTILDKAAKGVYDLFSLEREVDDFYWEKYFVKDGENYVLSENIKKNVVFKQHNLLEKPFDSHFDIIICRNVLIYFSNTGKNIVFNNFSNSLKSNGLLFLGPTEQFFDCNDFGFKLEKPSFYRLED